MERALRSKGPLRDVLPGNKSHYTQAWLSSLDRSCHSEAEPNRGRIFKLYTLCIKLFDHACSEPFLNFTPGVSQNSMRNELARLHLWGDSLDMVIVDDILDHSDDLKSRILAGLVEISRLLIRCKRLLSPTVLHSRLLGTEASYITPYLV